MTTLVGGTQSRRVHQGGSRTSARRSLFGSESTTQDQRQSRSQAAFRARDEAGGPFHTRSAAGFYGHTQRESSPDHQTTNFYGRESSPDHQTRSATSFYERTQREPSPENSYGHTGVNTSPQAHHRTWQPGEYLPSVGVQPPQQDIYSLVSQMQGVITAQLQKMQNSVEILSDRVNKIEKNLSDTTEQRCLCHTPTSSTSTESGSSVEKSRKRCTPTALSNLVRSIHNNLPSDKQLQANEAIIVIDSEHNKKTISLILEEVDDTFGEKHYTFRDIKGALSTYRRSLNRKSKDSDAITAQRLRRSRQQRKYERRGRHVLELEREKWSDVTPAMMSGEEDMGENTFKVHQPQWRSSQLVGLLQDLDGRADTTINKAHPRKKRVIGTPHKIPAPSCAKDWMKCDGENSSDDNHSHASLTY